MDSHIVSRIRTVKPDLLRHEALQNLEQNNPGSCVILVFIGLLTACDRLGHFPWEPRQLKLDIFPFLPFDMGKTLALLRENGFVLQYESGGKLFGEIPTFTKHQRISGKEAYDPPKYPVPSKLEKQLGSDGEATGKQLGRRERERELNQEGERELGKGKGNGNGKGSGSGMEPPSAVSPLERHEFLRREALSTVRSKGLRDFEIYPLEDWEDPMKPFDVQSAKKIQERKLNQLNRVGVTQEGSA